MARYRLSPRAHVDPETHRELLLLETESQVDEEAGEAPLTLLLKGLLDFCWERSWEGERQGSQSGSLPLMSLRSWMAACDCQEWEDRVGVEGPEGRGEQEVGGGGEGKGGGRGEGGKGGLPKWVANVEMQTHERGEESIWSCPSVKFYSFEHQKQDMQDKEILHEQVIPVLSPSFKR